MERASLFIGLALLAGSGCKSTSKQPVLTVRVRDAETKQPIPGAAVDLSEFRGTAVAKDVTAADGGVQIAKAPKDGDGFLDVSAKGYLGDAKAVYALTPASAQTVEVELYSAPRPAVELVIPAGFRGLIKADFKTTVADEANVKPRLFRAVVNADGTAQVVGPAILHAVTPQDVRAVGPDGNALPVGGPPAAVELRWVKTTEAMDYFIFGTQSECDDARKSIDPEDKSPRSSGGKGGGKGGGGRRGGGGGRGGGMGGGGMGGMGGGMGGMGR